MLSLQDKYAQQIIDGTKRIELRKRLPNIKVGSRIWLYSKVPIGAVLAYARLAEIIQLSPESMWRTRKSDLGISREEFRQYFSGSNISYGLLLGDVRRIQGVTLEELRSSDSKFHPPQFMRRVLPGTATYALLSAEV